LILVQILKRAYYFSELEIFGDCVDVEGGRFSSLEVVDGFRANLLVDAEDGVDRVGV
jgi:hypothetical protein